MTYQEQIARAFNAFRVKDLDLAANLGERLLALHPDSPDLFIFLGNIKTRQGQVKPAIDLYNKAIKLKPDSPEAYNNLSVAYKMNGDPDRALKAAEKAYSLSPRRADISYNLGNIYKETGRRQEAVEYYQLAVKADPSFVPVYNNLGNLYEKMGRHDLAEELYRKGLEYDENNPILHYNLGVTFDNAGEYDRSLEEYRRVQKNRPGWIDNLNNLAVTLQNLGKHEEAKHLFRRALEIDPENSKLNNNIGFLCTEMGSYDEAERYYKKAVSAGPGYLMPLINIGHLREKTGRYDKAIESFRSLVMADPENIQLQLDLVDVLIHEKELKEAGSILNLLGKKAPENPLVHLAKGNWYSAAGKKKKAVHEYNRTLTMDEGNNDARMHLALLYKEQKKYEKAIAEISHILLKMPESFAPRLLLGELYLEQNLYREALEIFESLDREYPENEDVLTALTHNYKAMGNNEKALHTAEKLATLQGGKGGAEDLARLDSTLEWYEQVAGEYAEEYEDIWTRNIRSLTGETEDHLEKGLQKEEESFILGKLFDINGETVPIIDTGGIEPYIEINEVTETMILREGDEEIPDFDEPVPEKETAGSALQPGQIGAPPAGTQPAGAGGVPSGIGSGQPAENRGNTAKAPREDTGVREDHIHVHTEAPGAIPGGGTFQASLRIESPIVIRREAEAPPAGPEETPERSGEKPERPDPVPPSPAAAERPSAAPPPQAPPAGEGKPEAVKKEETPAELLEYLLGLTRSLPDRERVSFDHSEMRLKIESIREKLKGKHGLAERLPKPEKKAVTTVTKSRIHDTLSFMESMSEHHPDATIGATLKQKIRHLLSKLEEPTHES